MVEVREFTTFFGHVPLMFVVRVLGDDGYGVGRQTFHDFAHNGGLARPRAARDSDDEHSVCGLVVMRKSTQKKRILEISLFQMPRSLLTARQMRLQTARVFEETGDAIENPPLPMENGGLFQTLWAPCDAPTEPRAKNGR